MKLTRKQKDDVVRLKNFSSQEIATRLNLEVGLVQNYLDKRNGVGLESDPQNVTIKIRPASETSLAESFLAFWKANQAKLLLILILGLTAYSTSLPNSFVSDDKPLMASRYLGNPLPIMKSEPVNAIINSLT